MPDITMCSGKNCPLSLTCKRYTSTPSQRQSYFGKPPIKKDKCDYYWGTTQNEIMQTLKDATHYENQFKPKKYTK